jgi:hypothetical protein
MARSKEFGRIRVLARRSLKKAASETKGETVKKTIGMVASVWFPHRQRL